METIGYAEMEDLNFETYLYHIAVNRNWHLSMVGGCQGIIGPVPPPFCIS